MHICPRCESQGGEIAKSPIQGVWEMYQCSICFFTWRSNEPESITNPLMYNKAFKVDPADVPKASVVPTVPTRRVLVTN